MRKDLRSCDMHPASCFACGFLIESIRQQESESLCTVAMQNIGAGALRRACLTSYDSRTGHQSVGRVEADCLVMNVLDNDILRRACS